MAENPDAPAKEIHVVLTGSTYCGRGREARAVRLVKAV
jgi:hypothetical protein